MDTKRGSQIVIAGGTGLVGTRLAQALLNQGAEVLVLSRISRSSSVQGLRYFGWEDLPALLEDAAALINLAGEGIANRRWSPARKAALRDSRIGPTRHLAEALASVAHPPPVVVNASAVGIYGARDETPVDERQPPGNGFLAELCREWEASADAFATLGLRVVKLRLGVVLAREGGALPEIARPVRLFAGAPLGSGRQGFSWIHIEDAVRLMIEVVDNPAYSGAINATAPHPCSHADLMRHVSKRLRRPVWPVPGFLTRAAVKLLLGEMAEPLLLGGAYVIPRKAVELGFQFRFPTLAEALEDLL